MQESSRGLEFFQGEEVVFEGGSKRGVSADSSGFGQDTVAGDEWRQGVVAQCVGDASWWEVGCFADLGIGLCMAGWEVQEGLVDGVTPTNGKTNWDAGTF